MSDPEKIGSRPSKLEIVLEGYRNKDTSHIILTPRVAHGILFESLLGYYKSAVEELDSKIGVLIEIAGLSSEEKIDFTAALNTFEEGRRNEA
ncbi:MAG: hypothetical protein NTZ07_01350, partial [Candidatus Woesebacteria bacterium]|nr:hypothetical protein [Candidatus Woesebacteria bacterium]